MNLANAKMFPTLDCPFDVGLHPRADDIEAGTVLWLSKQGLIASPAQRRKIERARFGRLAARCFPTTASEYVQLASDWNAWLFVRDDRIDESGLGKDPQTLHEHSEQLMAVLLTGEIGEDEPLCHSLLDIRTRLLEVRGLGWLARFAEPVQDYFDSCRWEAENRQRNQIPSVDSYLRLRRLTGGVLTCISLIELAVGHRLSLLLRQDSRLIQLIGLANDVICWSNDIFSLAKEESQGDFHNLCLLLHAHEGIPVKEAIGRVGRMHNEAVGQFVDAANSFVSCVGTEAASAIAFVSSLQYWMRANFDWSIESGRYGGISTEMVGGTLPGATSSVLGALAATG